MSSSNRILSKEKYSLCDQQADIFSLAVERGLPPACFVRSFMNGEFARAMDDGSFSHSFFSSSDVVGEISLKLKSKRGDGQYPQETLHWVGYIYRFWAIEKNTSSKEIIKIAPFSLMVKFCPLYHSQDAAKTVEMILESHGKKNEDMTFEEYYRSNKK